MSNVHSVPDGLDIYYQNVRGLGTKVHSVYGALLMENFTVVVFTETWLKEINNSLKITQFIERTLTSDKCKGSINSSQVFCLV